MEEAQLVITRQAVNNVEEEVQRFKGALDETIKATEKLAEDLATRVGEKEAEIMQGHMMLLADPMLTGEIENSVRNDGVNSEYAIENVCNMYADMFASMGDELMQQRATDMRDIKTRMQQMLMGIQSVDISSPPEGSIIVAKDLTPSMTAGINPANVTGIVTELGGKTSPQRNPGKSTGDSGCGGCHRLYGRRQGRGPGGAGRQHRRSVCEPGPGCDG